MKKTLIIASLFVLNNASSFRGSIETRRYFDSYYPGYLDYTGGNVNYGVLLKNDFLLWDFATNSLPDGRFYFGAEGYASTVFNQGGGVGGFELIWNKLELGLHHRSIHNFDYNGGKFLNQNYLNMTYKWGDGR